jgi:hypothetical protein
MNLSPDSPSTRCAVALKEWSVAVRALELGRQILLIRKGGLLDAEGNFSVEAARFFFAPTKWHQDANLLKPIHHDLLESDAPPQRGVLRLPAWAEVAQVWSLEASDETIEEKLMQLEHIWSTRYLDVRLNYQSAKPVQIVALRVHVLEAPHVVALQPEYSGCKSWIELESGLELSPSHPALADETFARELEKVRRVLEHGKC